MNYYNFSEDELKQEEWLPAFGWEGYYEVSNLGRVRRLYGKVLKPRLMSKYLQVALCKGGFMKNCTIHRLVAQTFMGPCPVKQEVDHIDRDRTNNRLSNLRYVTHKENLINTKRSRVVCKYNREHHLLNTYPSVTVAAEELSKENNRTVRSNYGGITYACTGKSKTCSGYLWSFENEPTGAEKKAFFKQLETETKAKL